MFTKLTRADVRFLVSLIVIHAAYFFAATVYKCLLNGDSQEYIDMAHNIGKGVLYAGDLSKPLSPELYTLRPPGYAFFLWVIYAFGGNNWAVLIVQCLISVFNIWYMRSIMRTAGYSRKYDWALMAFVFIYPSQYINANIIAPDLLLQTTVLLYFGSALKFLQEKQWRYALSMSIWLAVGLMIKPVMYPLVYIHAVFILIVGTFVYKALMRSFVAAMLPVLVVVVYGLFNQSRTGKLHFSSTQSFNAIFYYYNYYKETKGTDMASAFLQEERTKINAMPRFAERYDYANGRGLELLWENFGGYLLYHSIGSIRMLIDPGKGEIDMFTGKLTLQQLYDVHNNTGLIASVKQDGIKGLQAYISRSPSFPLAMLVFLFNLLRLIGLILFFNRRDIDYRIRLFVFLLTGYFIFIAGAISHVRYFMPVSLIVIGCSVVGYMGILHSVKNKPIIA